MSETTLAQAASQLPQQVICRNCGREIYPSNDGGVVTWTHKFSQSEPTQCKAEPTVNPLVRA